MNSRIACSFKIGLSISTTLFTISCGTDTPKRHLRAESDSTQNIASQMQIIRDKTPAEINISTLKSSVSNFDSFVEIDFRNSDFVTILRCSKQFNLQTPDGTIIRNISGLISSKNELELRAAWETALSATSACRLMGEKIVRSSLNDPLATSGKYYYLFNPCREIQEKENSPIRTQCSYRLRSSEEIEVNNTLDQKSLELAQKLNAKEAQLTGATLRFREQMIRALNSQKICENNESVDAVRESRWKALSSVLVTGVAASIGGLVGGPQSAIGTAQKTLQWIRDNVKSESTHNPKKCSLLKDAEEQTNAYAQEIEAVSNELSQLRQELAQFR